jgi:hypothetical protein
VNFILHTCGEVVSKDLLMLFPPQQYNVPSEKDDEKGRNPKVTSRATMALQGVVP